MYKKSLVFAAACIGMLLFGIVFLSLGTIFTFITSKFGVDELTAGSLASFLPLGILLGSVVFGPVVDRYGYKSLLIISSLLIVAGLEAIAFAGSFSLLQVAFFLIGFGGGVINGGTNALVADISSEGRGANLSLLGVFFGVGALGMPVLLGVLTKYFAYESIIAGIGLAVIIPVIYFIVIKFPVPKQAQGFPIKESFKLIKESTLILLGFILFFESGIEGMVSNWTTKYVTGGLNMSNEDALFILSAQVVMLTLTRLVLGGLLKRVPSYLVLYGCLVSAFIGGLLLYVAGSFTTAAIGLGFLGIGFAAGFPVILGYVGDIYSNLSGTAFSIALVIALVGNTLLNYLVGIISNSYGIEHFPLVLMFSVIAMAVLLSIVLKRISARTKI